MNPPTKKSSGPTITPHVRQQTRADQSRPAVAQLKKTVQQKPKVSSQTKTLPIAPPAYRPQPVPRVLQTKTAVPNKPVLGSQSDKVRGLSPVNRPQPTPQVLRKSLIIQRSRGSGQARYSVVRAEGGGHSVTGYSSGGRTGRRIDQLLRSARTDDARLFLYILSNVKKLSDRADRRTGFSCAEPHAVALLLSKGVRLSQIKVGTASDRGGLKPECPVCSQWMHHDGSIDDEAWRREYEGPEEVAEEVPPLQPPPVALNLKDENQFPPLGGRRQ